MHVPLVDHGVARDRAVDILCLLVLDLRKGVLVVLESSYLLLLFVVVLYNHAAALAGAQTRNDEQSLLLNGLLELFSAYFDVVLLEEVD